MLYLPAAHGHGNGAKDRVNELAGTAFLKGRHKLPDTALVGCAPENGGHRNDAGLASHILHLGPGTVGILMDTQCLLSGVLHTLHLKADSPEGGVLKRQIPCHVVSPLTPRCLADHDVLAALGKQGAVQLQGTVQFHLDGLRLGSCLHVLGCLQQNIFPVFW